MDLPPRLLERARKIAAAAPPFSPAQQRLIRRILAPAPAPRQPAKAA